MNTTAVSSDHALCQNCGAALQGPHCHACGQPVNGLVRPLGSVLGDVLDTVFEYDGRLWRTLGPLLLRPGRLTLDFFAGRRVRYVSPFRLVFFISVVAFLAMQFRIELDPGSNSAAGDFSSGFSSALQDGGSGQWSGARFAQAQDADAVAELLQRELAGIEAGRGALAALPAGRTEALAGMDQAEAAVRSAADARLRELAGIPAEARTADPGAAPGSEGDESEATAAGIAQPASESDPSPSQRPDPQRKPITLNFGGDRPWHPVDNPVRVGWLTEGLNQRLNRMIGRGLSNAERIRDDPNLLKDALLGALPVMLLAMLPVFALLLKLMYLFKRRLYMEHLLVGMHSHAFISLSVLLYTLLDFARDAFTSFAVLHVPLGWLQTALLAWVPIYLLLMQKRVYGQGWIMTLLKYFIIGGVYQIILSLALVATLLWTVASM